MLHAGFKGCLYPSHLGRVGLRVDFFIPSCQWDWGGACSRISLHGYSGQLLPRRGWELTDSSVGPFLSHPSTCSQRHPGDQAFLKCLASGSFSDCRNNGNPMMLSRDMKENNSKFSSLSPTEMVWQPLTFIWRKWYPEKVVTSLESHNNLVTGQTWLSVCVCAYNIGTQMYGLGVQTVSSSLTKEAFCRGRWKQCLLDLMYSVEDRDRAVCPVHFPSYQSTTAHSGQDASG